MYQILIKNGREKHSMGKNYILPKLKKTNDIGNTVEDLNRSFTDYESFLRKEKDDVEKIQKNIIGLDRMLSKIEESCLFLEENANNLSDLYTTIKLNIQDWLKPIVLFYKEKFFDDLAVFSEEYIDDTVCKWVQSNYPVVLNKKSKPKYIEGQTAYIFYLKVKDKEQNFKYNQESSVTCVTEDVDVKINCKTIIKGKTCQGGCGCVDCALTQNCKKTKEAKCRFKDRGLDVKSIKRYLKMTAEYSGDDTYDTKIGRVKLVVKDCEWQIEKKVVDKVVAEKVVEKAKVVPPKGLITFEDKKDISIFGTNGNITPF